MAASVSAASATDDATANRGALVDPRHKNAGAFLRLPANLRPTNSTMLEALDIKLGGRPAVAAAISRGVFGLPSGYRAFVLVALWEEHCFEH